MNWKKNGFGYLMWIIYVLMIGGALAGIGNVICGSFQVATYFGVVAAAVYVLAAGAIVLLLHRMAKKYSAATADRQRMFRFAEGGLVLLSLISGLLLRLTGLSDVSEQSTYFELAQVVLGQEIPRIAHGAVYLYLQLLHFFFLILGNKYLVGIGLQIGLQLAASLILYAALKGLAGRVPALMTLAFFMLSPYTIGKSLALSPEMLYLVLFSLVLLYLSACVRSSLHWGLCLLGGCLAAVLSYLDVAGILTLVILFGVLFAQGEQGKKVRIAGAFAGGAGFLLGAVACFLTDALSSGSSVIGVLNAWVQTYHWEQLKLSVTVTGLDTVWMSALLLCFMVWGIFSFWCAKAYERFGVWIFCMILTVLAQCVGIFTPELDGYGYLLLFCAVLAGISVRESIFSPARANGIPGGATMEKGAKMDREKAKEAEERREEATNSETQFIENPLPLPKKHEKRIMDYDIELTGEMDDYDVAVADDDDFDI